MLTMATVLERAALLYGRRMAILDRDDPMTWAEYVDRIARTAGMLAGLGLRPGERLGILSQNSVRFAELINGAYWLGVVPVPVNHRLAPQEIRYILEDAECRLLALEEEFTSLLEQDGITRWCDTALHMSPGDSAGPGRDYETLLASARPGAVFHADPQSDAILLYTGGTTGRSKGVRLTHANILSNAMQIAQAVRACDEDRYLHVSPMFHSADLFATAFTMTGGAHAYLRAYTPDDFLSSLQEYQITVLNLAPVFIIRTLQSPDVQRYDCSCLRQIFYGSAPLAVEWVKAVLERFPGVDLTQGYGLTETAPVLTAMSARQTQQALAAGDDELLRSVGKPLPHVDLRIVDRNGETLPAGEIGEIVVRGPNVTPGYLGLPEQNRESFRNGWFHTGDLGRLDAEYNLYILDRAKDMIITGSLNVYSAEVENVLHRHPAVSEAAVIGVPDPQWGEAVFAIIVPVPGAVLTDGDIIEHCRAQIGGFKIPRRMAFVDALPKSPVGKVLKTELRRRYGAG